MKKNLKGIMGVLLSATLFAGAVTASPVMAGTSANILLKSVENASDGAVTYIYGDVDLNNKLEAVDALAVLKHVVKLTPLDGELVLELADTDHDTSITAADALAVLKCVVGLQNPSYYTVTPPASKTPPATESGEPTSPAPSESVTPPETPTPDVTETPAPSAPAETVVPTATPDVTETLAPTATPDVTVEPTKTPVPTATPSVTEAPAPTETVVPTATPDVTVEPTDTPVPTETPAPTVTPTETPAPHVHNYTSEITLEATCGKDGVETFTCECGDTFTKPIPATGEHTYEKTEEKVWIVDEEAYDEEVIDQKTVWVCHGCPTDTYFYSPEEINAHRKETSHYSIEQVIQRNVEVVHHKEAGHFENVYKCTICGVVKENTKPDPATCEHTYERTENRVWHVDQEAYDEIKKTKSVWVCSCGEKFASPERLTAHHLSMWNADIAGHGASSVETLNVNEVIHHEEVGHYENEVTYTCSICGDVKEYSDPETCAHDWYIAREPWVEYVEERHGFCECGYDCGLYDWNGNSDSDISKAAIERFDEHFNSFVVVDPITGEMIYDNVDGHTSFNTKVMTYTYPHTATYRCALCGKYKDTE